MFDALLAGGGSLLGRRGLLGLFVVVRRWVLGVGFLVGVLGVGVAGVAVAEEGEVLDVEALHEVIREAYPLGDSGGGGVGVRYPDDKWEFLFPFEKKAYVPIYETWFVNAYSGYSEVPLDELPITELISPSAREEWTSSDLNYHGEGFLRYGALPYYYWTKNDFYHVGRVASGAAYDEIVMDHDAIRIRSVNDDGSIELEGSRYLYFMFSGAVVTVGENAVLPWGWEKISLDMMFTDFSEYSLYQFDPPLIIHLADDMVVHDQGDYGHGNYEVFYGNKGGLLDGNGGNYGDALSMLHYSGITVRRDSVDLSLHYDAVRAVNLLSLPKTQMRDKSLLFVLPDRVLRLRPDGRVPDALRGRVQWDSVATVQAVSGGWDDSPQAGLYVRRPWGYGSFPYSGGNWVEGIEMTEARLGEFEFVRRYLAYLREKFPRCPSTSIPDSASEHVRLEDCEMILMHDYIVDARLLHPLGECIGDGSLRRRFLAVRDRYLLPKMYCDFYLNHSSVDELAAFVGALEGSSDFWGFWGEGVELLEGRFRGFGFVRRYLVYLRKKFSECESAVVGEGALAGYVRRGKCERVLLGDYIEDKRFVASLGSCIGDASLRGRFMAVRERYSLPKMSCDFYLRHSSVDELAVFVGELEGWDGGGS